ncbi:MAG: sodium:proton antiporter [Oculatellaceae cyanobacterium Prado106]|nr:sodium:proton antiporter [Oculatellaceae cyanobacterium Prado106]
MFMTLLASEITLASEVTIEGNLKSFLLVLAVSLSVATLPQFLGWFRRIPYMLLLVIVGLGLAFVDVRLVNLSPELILSIFLPPLLFEAAWNLRWSELKQQWIPISLYSILGVLISIAGVTVGLNTFVSLSLPTALLIGASLSATDPVSVIALFRELGVDKRLSTIMEGESLFNDGMAVVAFSFLMGLPLGAANLGTADLTVPSMLLEFLRVVGVGVAVGCLIGFSISYLTQRFDLPLVEQSLTLVSAYATYLIAEDFGGSGVIAVVVTGLVLGNFGSLIGMNPRTRIVVTQFWEFLAFFVNSIVFLLIGDQIHFSHLAENLGVIGVTIASLIVSRAIAIALLSRISNLQISNLQISNIGAESAITWQQQTVLWWGGLRGSVAIALALSLPVSLPARETLIATVFGVVLFTLLVQGLTIQPLLAKLNLLGNQPLREVYSECVARRVALNRVLEHLNQVEQQPELDQEFYHYQMALIKGEIEQIQSQITQLQEEYPQLQAFMNEQFREELLAIEARTYAELVRAGQLKEELAPLLQITPPES